MGKLEPGEMRDTVCKNLNPSVCERSATREVEMAEFPGRYHWTVCQGIDLRIDTLDEDLESNVVQVSTVIDDESFKLVDVIQIKEEIWVTEAPDFSGAQIT